MIVFLVDAADLPVVEAQVSVAKQRLRVAQRVPVKYVRQPTRLPEAVAQVLAFKHVYAEDAVMKAWCAAQPGLQRIALWPRTPHPEETRTVAQHHPELRWAGLYEDIVQPAFWERVQFVQHAEPLIATVQSTLLTTAPAWHPEARPLLQRLVSNLHLSTVTDIARQVYGGRNPGHQFAKVCRNTGHANPKQLLSAAQLTAYRYAVEQGAAPGETAQVLGRRSATHFQRIARETLKNAYPLYREAPSQPLLRCTLDLFAAREGNPLLEQSLEELVRNAVAA